MEGFKTEIKESKNVVKELKAQVNLIENKYKSEIEYWVQKNNDLQKQIQQTETNLNVSTQKENSLQGKIRVLISEKIKLKDTSEIISNCDSLNENVSQYITETNVRDSLCDNEISELKTVIQNKDSAMAGCEKSFSMLRQVVDSSLTFQNKLTDELCLADKKIKRGKLKTKFLSAGVMILATATTILLLQKKP
jgi:chromosome segregation ATPase